MRTYLIKLDSDCISARAICSPADTQLLELFFITLLPFFMQEQIQVAQKDFSSGMSYLQNQIPYKN